MMESHSLLLHTEFKARPELCACAAVLLSFSALVSQYLPAEPWEQAVPSLLHLPHKCTVINGEKLVHFPSDLPQGSEAS